MTQFKKYQDQQAKTTAQQTAASMNRNRTKAVVLASQTDALQNKIGELDFSSLSAGDREMATESLNSLKSTLYEALTRRQRKGRLWRENDRERRYSINDITVINHFSALK